MPWRRLCVSLLAVCLALPAFARAEQNPGEPSVQTYAMDEAVARALAANPGVDASRHGVDASDSALKAARSAFGPSVNGSYNFTYYDKERLQRNDKRAYTFGLGVSQPLFTGFQLLNAYQKAALEKDNQELQLRNAELAIVGQVQAQFLNFLKAEENIRSNTRAMERAREQMAMARAAFDVGLRPNLDVIQATLELTRSEALLIQSENARDLCRAQLNTLLNLRVEDETGFVGTLDLIPFDKGLQECLETAFRQRPDLLMAVKSVEIAGKDLGIVRGALYPQVNASINWNTTGDDMAAAGSRRAAVDYSAWSAGVTLQWNLFNSGRHVFQSRQVRSLIAALESQLQAGFNNAALEIKSCLASAMDAKRMVEVSERAVISANESYDNARMRYELQLGTNLDLLTAQADLSSAELGLISSKADYLSALSRLYVAMGEIHPDLRDVVSGSQH